MSKPVKVFGATSLALAIVAGALLVLPSTTNAIPPDSLDPADFSDPRPNPYFPLEPGTISRYRGEEDGETFRERVVVTDRIREITGITTVVVTDVLRVDGYLAELTEDWYQADDTGAVWYFGEDTAEYNKKGEVISTAGSWEAGVNGARAGTIMPANPRPSDAYFQEYYPGEAEDQAWVVNRRGEVTVPYGTLDEILRTYEWSRLEPSVVGMKLYAPGLGIVKERSVAGGNELLELLDVKTVEAP